MTRQKAIQLLLLIISLATQTFAAGAQRAPRPPFGLRLGMSEEAAQERLRKIATKQQEEREEEEGGEQEVWILKQDAKYNYLIAKFSSEHRLILITVVARPNQMRYADLASLNTASKASDGQNYSYKWKVELGKGERAYVINARGSSPEFLTSYSVYFVR
jgi:poly-D-alanine transfer protein DltD